MNIEEVKNLTFTEYANIVAKKNGITFGEVFRTINDYFSISETEHEKDIVSALWELDEDLDVFEDRRKNNGSTNTNCNLRAATERT